MESNTSIEKNTDSADIRCPLCGNGGCRVGHLENEDNYFCPQCGSFSLHYRNSGIDDENRHLIAGYLFETRKYRTLGKERTSHFTDETTKSLLSSPMIPKTSMQRLDKLLLCIYNTNPGFNIYITDGEFCQEAGYAKDKVELDSMFDALCDLKYLKCLSFEKTESAAIISRFISDAETLKKIRIKLSLGKGSLYQITIKGIQHAENLLTDINYSKKVFIAMAFTDEMKAIRDNAIIPACRECGFEATTVDQNLHNGNISDKIISEIKNSKFVIADFTGNNYGAYYEAGFAFGLGLPVIKTCSKNWIEEKDKDGKKRNNLHFDIAQDYQIRWDNAADLKSSLIDRIRATIL